MRVPHPFVVFAKGWDGFDLLSEPENLRNGNFGNFGLLGRKEQDTETTRRQREDRASTADRDGVRW